MKSLSSISEKKTEIDLNKLRTGPGTGDAMPPARTRLKNEVNNMMIGSKGLCDALAQSHVTLIDPQNTNGVVILHSKMTRAVSVLAAHCTRSVRAADHQLGAKYLLTPAS